MASKSKAFFKTDKRASFLKLVSSQPLVCPWSPKTFFSSTIGGSWHHEIDNLTFLVQSFDTEKGAIYTVTFGLAANPEHPRTEIVHVSVGDFKKPITTPKSPFNKQAGKPFPIKWAEVKFAFKATDSKSTIRFEAPYGNKGVYGTCIDNVRIVKGEYHGTFVLSLRLKTCSKLRSICLAAESIKSFESLIEIIFFYSCQI
jgi:hypothetical protein